MPAPLRISIGFVFALLPSVALAVASQVSRCQPAGTLAGIEGLREGSGLALSRRTPGRLWTHNDSGAPVLVALDASGSVMGRVRVTGATVEDWEAIASAPCGTQSCLYIGDIGDNNARRSRVTIYRLPEPDPASGSVAVAEVYHAAYPDGAHDAEALFITADGRLHIVTKGSTGRIALYRFPAQLQAGATMRLERVGGPSTLDARTRVTDGTISPDGQWTVLRTHSALLYYRTSDFMAGRWQAASTVDLTRLKEPQGEGVAIDAANTVFLVGEGGGPWRSGTFARFTCAPG